MCQGRLKGHTGPHNFVEPDGKPYTPPPPPTLDEKIEAIAARLQADAKRSMEFVLESESNINYYYSRSDRPILNFRF